MTNPYKELASVIEQRMAGHAARAVSGTPCELGTVTAGGLKLDSFKYEIKDYLVADWQVKVYFPAFFFVGTGTSPVDSEGNDLPGATASALTRYDYQAKEVDEVRLEPKPGFKPGDRVLAASVNGGQDYVVLCKVVPNA